MSSRAVPGWRSRRLALLSVLGLLGASLVLGSAAAAAGGSKDHFKASATTEDAGGEAGELREMHDIQSFDEHAEANPVTGAQALFSRCRFSPFADGTVTYAPISGMEHDVIIDDTAFEFADGTSCYNPQNEQNIVVNPTNDQNIVTSANDYRYEFRCYAYVSMDGGDTWANVAIPGWSGPTGAKGQFVKTGCGGDPVMAFGSDGTLYFASLTYNLDKFPREMSGVAVSSSKDGGLTWAAPVMVSYNAAGNFFLDKEWIGVAPDGTVNLTWTTFYQGPRGLSYIKSPIVMASSRNGGKSWSSVKAVSDPAHPYNQGSQVGSTPDGTLYVIYEGASPNTGYATDAMVVARSTNGGTTFSTTEIARVYDDLDCYPLQVPGGQGRQTLTNEQFRLNSYPSMAIDPTTGQIAVVWSDDQGAGTCGSGGTTFAGTTSNQVKLMTSSNGTSWSSVRTLTSGADKVFPSVGANAGKISVGYYTREYATSIGANRECGIMERDTTTGAFVVPTDAARASAVVCLDWAVKTSSDNFGSTTRVTAESSNPYILFSGSFIGDYTGTAVDSQGTTVTVWTDFRGNPGVTTPNQDTLVGVIPGH
ncbi:MAG: sialidase family protein [Candidatus Limnocylindrales bacterium]